MAARSCRRSHPRAQRCGAAQRPPSVLGAGCGAAAAPAELCPHRLGPPSRPAAPKPFPGAQRVETSSRFVYFGKGGGGTEPTTRLFSL